MPLPDFLAKRNRAVCDTECYRNLWAIGFKDLQTGKKVIMWQDHQGRGNLDLKRIATILRNYRLYTFNGIGYDIPMITFAMTGANCTALKKLNDEIIPGGGAKGLQYWHVYDNYDISPPSFLDHIDLMPVAPSAAQMFSLKKYGVVMGSRWIKDLPYLPDRWLSESEIDEVLEYLGNDLDLTHDLADELQPQIDLRAEISEEYRFDFRSKSDAQCGEAVVKLLVEKRVGHRIYKPDINREPFKLEVPKYIKFKTPYMQSMLDQLARSDFYTRHDGYVQLPEMFSKKKGSSDDLDDEDVYEGGAEITIGEAVYKMGIGGLHSQEKSVTYYATDDLLIIDVDVTSYYPWLIIRSGREPENMRGHFRMVFEDLVKRRVKYKRLSQIAERNGHKEEAKKLATRAESLKIFINGIFGKTGSPYSVVYAPKMMIQTTVPGQLSLLMLIEAFHVAGFKVIQANTDGIVSLVPKERYGEFWDIYTEWEEATGLGLEETRYRSIHSRDVNSYVAFDMKGKPKRKGTYAPSGRGIKGAAGLKKTPNMEVSVEAAIKFLEDGTRIEETVRNCQDIKKFVVGRKVKGGALYHGELIGKTVRYFLADDEIEPLRYQDSGNKVPKSDGAEPVQVLPDRLPRNIDYAAYEREAYAILHDMGMKVVDPLHRGRHGYVLAHREEQKTVHHVDAGTGIAVCGATRKEFRDKWCEIQKHALSYLPMCGKCKKAMDL